MQQSAKLFLIWLKRLSLLDRSVVRKPKTGEERRINLLSAKTLLLIKLDKLWTNALDINCPVPTGLQSQWKLIFYSMFTSKTQPELLRKSRYKYSTLIGPQCFSGQGHTNKWRRPLLLHMYCVLLTQRWQLLRPCLHYLFWNHIGLFLWENTTENVSN